MPEMDTEKLAEMRVLAEKFVSPKAWTVTKDIGSGGSAAVFLVRAGERDVALKVYDPSFLAGQEGAAERHRIELQRNLIGHENPVLVKILQVDYAEDTCFIQMEYVPWEEMRKRLNHIPREAISPLITQLLQAVRFLDEQGLVHRDIKPHNILVSPDSTQLKLIDLGIIRESSETEDRVDGTDHGRRRPFIATAQYSSPEYLFRTTPPSAKLWQALTFYQIGAVLHDLITRIPLFSDEVATGNRYAVSHAVQSKVPSLETADEVPKELKRLAAHCLVKDPDRRLRLVSWDDFTPMKKGDLTALNHRIEKLQELQIHRAAMKQDELKHTLARRVLVSKINFTLREKLIGAISGANIETIKGDDEESCAILRFHLPTGGWAIDLFIELQWPESGQMTSETEISIRATLVKATTAPEFMNGGTLITVIAEDGVNVDIAIETIFSRFLSILEAAVSNLEDDIENSNDSAIELPV